MIGKCAYFDNKLINCVPKQICHFTFSPIMNENSSSRLEYPIIPIKERHGSTLAVIIKIVWQWFRENQTQ
jgi:hypothetical protein